MKSGSPGHPPPYPRIYEIRIRGALGLDWADQLGGLDLSWDRDGDTILAGPIVDQAALHALLRRLRDLGVTLISINSREGQEDGSERA